MPTTPRRTQRTLNPRSFLQRRLTRLIAAAGLTLAGLVGSTALPGCSSAEKPGPIVELPNQGFARKWATTLQLDSTDAVAQVFVRGDLILVYTTSANMYGLKADNGQLLFGTLVAGGRDKLRPPIVLKDYVVVPTTTTLELFSLNGVFARSINIHAAIRADPVGDLHNIFVPVDSPEGGGRIKRIDVNAPSDRPVWELQVQKGGIHAAPTAHTDAIYLASEDGTVYAVNVESREPIWGIQTFDSRSGVIAPLRSDDVGLYVPTLDGVLYCLHRTQGTVKWRYYAGGALETSPVLTTDTVYLLDPKRGTVAIDKVENPDIKTPQYNRKERWARTDIKQILAQDAKNLYALDTSNYIGAYDKKTGEPKFKSQRNDFSAFGTNTRDGITFAATRKGRIIAVKPILAAGQSGEVVRLENDREAEGVVAMQP